jgi:DNA mismatch repair protein MSH2
VIVDELGRGTSTFDGFGLAWAISQHLVSSVGCWTIFATHFHELTLLAAEEAKVVNRHVAAHVADGKVTFLYEVKDGPCLASYGVHVAAMANFPNAVIACAASKAAELEGYDGGSAAAASSSDTPAAKKQRVGAPGAAAENRKLVALAASVKQLQGMDALDPKQRLGAVRKLAAEAGLV